MKKFFLTLAVALPMFFMAACGDDNEDDTILSLDQTAVTLDYGNKTKIVPSEKKGEWASSNEFVATVDKDGNVEAKHVGKATLTYVKDGQSASCTVTVNATNNNFDTIITWGVSNANIKSAVPAAWKLITENNGNLMYSVNAAEDFPWYGFLFANDKLNGSSIYFEDATFENEDFNGYLAQHFKYIEDNENEEAVYANANTLSEASLAATVGYDADLEVYTVIYTPVSHTKAGGVDSSVVLAAKELYKVAKNK